MKDMNHPFIFWSDVNSAVICALINEAACFINGVLHPTGKGGDLNFMWSKGEP